VSAGNDLVEAFASAVGFALREMAAVEAFAGDAHRAPTAPADGCAELSAVIRLTAPGGEGRMVLSCPESTATALARRVLVGVADDPPADLVRDCLGEVANVVAGQAKALLVGHPAHFTLSTPTVHTGNLGAPATERWVIPFVSDAGEFTVYLYPPAGTRDE
jgi:chemotaxis protein CheX